MRASSAALALCACALGFACGQPANGKGRPLAPAGSARDDGSGLLARLSTDATLGRDPARRAAAKRGAAARRPGHGARRAASDAGTPYSNYRFDRTPRPHSAPLPYARRYTPVALAALGSIDGVVLWPHPPRAPERLGPARTTAPHGAACPAGVPNQTLALGAGGGVANAVVYLEDVSTGRLLLGRTNSTIPGPTKQLQTGGMLEWRDCRFHPQVQVAAPIGSVLWLSSADEAIEVGATRVEGRSREPLWSVQLGGPGVAREQFLGREGFLELRAGRAGPTASAWIVVAPHPYFALTDERGSFTLEEVPPGSYTLVVWHQPVVVGSNRAGEPIVQSAPMVRRRVVVRARQVQRVIVRLPAAH